MGLAAATIVRRLVELEASARAIREELERAPATPAPVDLLDERNLPGSRRRRLDALRRGELAGVKNGNKWLVRKQDWELWLAAHAKRKPGPAPAESGGIAAALGLRKVG